MNTLADSLIPGLLRASLLLTASAVLVALCVRLTKVRSPRAEQWAWFCVLLQGLLVAPVLITLPAGWLTARPAAVESPTASTPPPTLAGLPTPLLSSDHPSMQKPSSQAAAVSSTVPVSAIKRPLSAWLPRWSVTALFVWASGLLSLLLLSALRYREFVRRLRGVCDPEPKWSDEWRAVLKEAGIDRRIDLGVSTHIGPMVCRLPSRLLVVVPESLWTELSSAERIAVLRHEFEHIRRGDLSWSLIARLLATVHWFNPCAWWAAANFDAQGEFACDQAVGTEGRLTFADLLLRLGTGLRLQPVGVKAVASGRMHERIRRLIAGAPPVPRWSGGLPVAVAVLIACLAGIRFEQSTVTAVAQEKPAGEVPEDSKTSIKQLRQIGLALHNTHDLLERFPERAIFGRDGQPLLSWRVRILPYLGQGYQELYEQFHLDEPWHSPHNKALILSIPEEYKSSSGDDGGGRTRMLATVGKDTMFPPQGTHSRDAIRDEPSQTIMVVEAPEKLAVIWTRPDDYEVDPADPFKGLTVPGHDSFRALYVSGHVREVTQLSSAPENLQLLNIADGPPRVVESPPPVVLQVFPSRLELGTVFQGAMVEASVAAEFPTADLKKSGAFVETPDFVSLSKSEMQPSMRQPRQDIGRVTAYVSLDTDTPGERKGTIALRCGEREVAIPVEMTVVPKPDGVPRILIVSSPYEGAVGAQPDDFRTLHEITSSGAAEFNFIETITAERYATQEYLAQFDVILLQYTMLISSGTDEHLIEMFQQYVRNGGRLIVLANRFMVGTVHSANEIARPLGLQIDAGEIEDANAGDRRRLACGEAQIEPDSLTADVDEVNFFRASPIVVTDPAIGKLLVRSPVRPRDGIVAVGRVGNGELVLFTQTVLPIFLGDVPGPFGEVADNRTLFRNLLFAPKPQQ